MPRPGPGPARSGTKLVIVGVALSLTAGISISALVAQLFLYDPPCEPLAWNLGGACGVLRLLVLLMVPFLVMGLAFLLRGVVLLRRDRVGPPP